MVFIEGGIEMESFLPELLAIPDIQKIIIFNIFLE